MARIEVRILPYKEGNRFGYLVVHTMRIDSNENRLVYRNEAKAIDASFVLEESYGNTLKHTPKAFGVAQREDLADKRLRAKARRFAKKTLESLVPELKDFSRRKQRTETGDSQ